MLEPVREIVVHMPATNAWLWPVSTTRKRTAAAAAAAACIAYMSRAGFQPYNVASTQYCIKIMHLSEPNDSEK